MIYQKEDVEQVLLLLELEKGNINIKLTRPLLAPGNPITINQNLTLITRTKLVLTGL